MRPAGILSQTLLVMAYAAIVVALFFLSAGSSGVFIYQGY